MGEETIEILREKMDKVMSSHSDLTCDKVIEISQRLDKLIVEYYNCMAITNRM